VGREETLHHSDLFSFSFVRVKFTLVAVTAAYGIVLNGLLISVPYASALGICEAVIPLPSFHTGGRVATFYLYRSSWVRFGLFAMGYPLVVQVTPCVTNACENLVFGITPTHTATHTMASERRFPRAVVAVVALWLGRFGNVVQSQAATAFMPQSPSSRRNGLPFWPKSPMSREKAVVRGSFPFFPPKDDAVVPAAAAVTATPNIAVLGGAAALLLSGVGLALWGMGDTGGMSSIMAMVQQATSMSLSEMMQAGMDHIQAMGPLGMVYFVLCFVALDVVSIPATPLVLSAGSLFGLPQGVALVLISGTLSACTAYAIGQTVLRTYVQDTFLRDNPKMARLDTAIGNDGFKVLFLLRLAPIFPLSLINYVYGASSIDFVSYFWGTLLGFAPCTIAYVYTGMVGQELLSGDSQQPWYMYAAGLAVVVAVFQQVTSVATGMIAALDDDGDSTLRSKR
jgi:uncharacterized membrane protein YdjX (TVP38/TMEM64 family)